MAIGGSLGRNEATARGAVYTLLQASRVLNLPLPGARVAIQGFGNAGSIAATLLGAGPQRAAEYSWRDAAAKTLSLLARAAAED